MNHAENHLSDSAATFHAAGQLLEHATAMHLVRADLPELRREILERLANLVGANAGFWSWGHGHPLRSPALPVALIDFGLSDEQRALTMAFGLSAEIDEWFRLPIAHRMGERAQETTISEHIESYTTRRNVPKLFMLLDLGNWTDWMHSVRYSATDNWSNLFLMRPSGRFTQSDANIVDFAMRHIGWLHAHRQITVPTEKLAGLTNRQQVVMSLLLDGLSRKMIAKRLSISEDTIGDHIKAIYVHFDVNSATELAAMFLRGT